MLSVLLNSNMYDHIFFGFEIEGMLSRNVIIVCLHLDVIRVN